MPASGPRVLNLVLSQALAVGRYLGCGGELQGGVSRGGHLMSGPSEQ